MRDPYLYPNSEVLKNLADVQEEQILKDMEADYTSYRLSEIVADANLVDMFAVCMARLWKVHPYREGNTRTIVTFCSMFIETQGIYIESELFKDHASYMRDALVAANAVFHDIGDLRKPEYLQRIVRDALEQGKEMREHIEEQFRTIKLTVSEEDVRKIVFWNRKEREEHAAQEIRQYLRNEIK